MSDTVAGRPVLYLDVDGVLNPFRSKAPHDHWPDYRKHTVVAPRHRSYRVWGSPELGRAIVELAASYDIEVVWATSWAAHVDTLIVPLWGLPAGWRGLAYPDAADGDRRNTGKVAEVAADAGDRPVIWIDDCLGPDDRAWAAGRGAPTLLLRPHPSHGLRRGDLDEIAEWIETFASR
jgi:hypothetical protein